MSHYDNAVPFSPLTEGGLLGALMWVGDDLTSVQLVEALANRVGAVSWQSRVDVGEMPGGRAQWLTEALS